jgi:hypothetical protein
MRPILICDAASPHKLKKLAPEAGPLDMAKRHFPLPSFLNDKSSLCRTVFSVQRLILYVLKVPIQVAASSLAIMLRIVAVFTIR